jgi:Flp pilus assembly protein TadD
MLLLFAWHARQGRRRFLAGMAGSVLCLVLLVLLLPLSTGQRLREIRNYGSPAQERLGMAQAALSMAKDRPVAGIGPGNFEKAFDRYKFPNVRGLSHYGKTTDFAHNEILQILAVLGIPGLLLLVWLLAATGRSFSAFWRNKIPDPVRLGCWAALAGSSVQALADFNWHLPGLWVWGLLLLAVAQSPQPPAVAPAAVPAEPRLRYRGGASLFLLGLLVLAACLAAWRPLLSAYYQKLGEAQRYKQNLPAAAAEFTTALEFYPFASEAYDHLGQVHADLYATTGAENEFRLAEWAFQKAQSQDRLDAFVHRHLGMLYAMKGGRLSDTERWRFLTLAEEQYRLAVQRAPTNAMIFFEMGNLLRDAGRLSQAESAWREAVQLEPNYAAAWSNLGVAMELRDNNTDAEACLRRALTLRALVPQVEGKYEIELLSLDWSVVHYNLGHLMEHNGRWSEAREEYLAVLEMEPNNRQVRQRVKALEKIVP